MKKSIFALAAFVLTAGLYGCGSGQSSPTTTGETQTQGTVENTSVENTTESEITTEETQPSTTADGEESETGQRQILMRVNGEEIIITLYDTPAANSLYDMLPLELTFEDYNHVEKISYLEEELNTEGEPDGFEPKIGDVCLYAPWGNLSIFYEEFRYSNSLILLGHMEEGIQKIAAMSEDFPVTLEKINE